MGDALHIAVDPGATSGLAGFVGADLRALAVIKRVGASDPWVRVDALRAALKALAVPTRKGGQIVGQVVTFATEDQFLGAPRGSSRAAASMFGSTAKVGANAAVWEAVAALLGLTVLERVLPATHRAAVGAARGNSRMRDAVVKEVLTARWPEWSLLDTSDDARAAVMVGVVSMMKASNEHWAPGVAANIDGLEWVRQARWERQPKRAPTGPKRKRKP